jgi:3-phytase
MLALALLPPPPYVAPALATQPVAHDADDPAVWVHPTQPAKSLIIGTDKEEKVGGLYVFDLSGKVVQRITKLDRPNNVDVEGNLVVVTERMKRRLKIYEVSPQTGRLRDVSGDTKVFEGEQGEDGAPMGVALYRRPKDRAVFAIVTPKEGATKDHLAQYRIARNFKTGKYDALLVRRFGSYSGVKETESVAVDDAKGLVYYSDETVGTHIAYADPMHRRADREWPMFNTSGTVGDHEGIAIWPNADAIVCTDQIEKESIFRVFNRQNRRFVGAFRGGSDDTDGIEICDRPLGPRFPAGIMVAMNSGPRNFLVYDLRDVAQALNLSATK